MLSGPKRRIAIGLVLLAVGSIGLALAAGRALLLQTHRHVIVEISNVDGIEQVFIDCHLAVRVESGESGGTFDLGWLQPDDRIFLSTTSIDRNPAWSFRGSSNGTALFEESRGNAELPRFAAPAHAVVFAEAFLAGGPELGEIGCQPPEIVAVEGYARSPDDEKVAEVTEAKSSYRRPNELFDWIDAIGHRSLVALAVLGAFAAIGTPSIRRSAWSHKGRLAGGALAILGAGLFGIAALPTVLTLGGILLLFAVSIVLVLPASAGRL